jgi:hypothetical protein
MPQLRVQLTLLSSAAGGRHAPILPGEFRTTLSASGQHVTAIVFADAPILPGRSAVHDVSLPEPSRSKPLLPPGAQFELWESGRKGYGSVLNHYG